MTATEQKIKQEKQLIKKLKSLRAKRIKNVQMLQEWDYDELEKLAERLFQCAMDLQEEQKQLAHDFVYEKYSQVDDALRIKKGNETEVWDFLS